MNVFIPQEVILAAFVLLPPLAICYGGWIEIFKYARKYGAWTFKDLDRSMKTRIYCWGLCMWIGGGGFFMFPILFVGVTANLFVDFALAWATAVASLFASEWLKRAISEELGRRASTSDPIEKMRRRHGIDNPGDQ